MVSFFFIIRGCVTITPIFTFFLYLFSFKFIYDEVQSIIIDINDLGCVFYGFER